MDKPIPTGRPLHLKIKIRRFFRRNYATIMIVGSFGFSVFTYFSIRESRHESAVEYKMMQMEMQTIKAENAEIKAKFQSVMDYTSVLAGNVREMKGYRQAKADQNIEKLVNNLPEFEPKGK